MHHVIQPCTFWRSFIILSERFVQYLTALALAVFEIWMGPPKFKTCHVTLPCPFQGQFVICRLGLAMINLCTKLEDSTFTHYEDMKGDKNVEIGVVCRVRGPPRSLAT